MYYIIGFSLAYNISKTIWHNSDFLRGWALTLSSRGYRCYKCVNKCNWYCLDVKTIATSLCSSFYVVIMCEVLIKICQTLSLWHYVDSDIERAIVSTVCDVHVWCYRLPLAEFTYTRMPFAYLTTTAGPRTRGLMHLHICATYFRCLMNREVASSPPRAVTVTRQITDVVQTSDLICVISNVLRSHSATYRVESNL